MAVIHFTTVVDRDQVIRPPNGITLPEGEIDVTVRQHPAALPVADPLGITRDWLLSLAADAEKAQPSLPADLAERHDHYAHGKPRP
jgi:hypothetical protein